MYAECLSQPSLPRGLGFWTAGKWRGEKYSGPRDFEGDFGQGMRVNPELCFLGSNW